MYRFQTLVLLGASAACACSAGIHSTRTARESFEPVADRVTATTEDAAIYRTIAAEYESWKRVDDWNHWAPYLCRIQPSEGRLSASGDGATHGGKLYYLYARDRAAYVDCRERDQPIGQVIVKESWDPVELGPDERVDEFGRTPDGHSVATRDGKRWKPGSTQGLFVMRKLGMDVAGTDQGWVYATTSADGTVVHESGRIENCMGCHAAGTRDRLFGLAR